MEYQQGEHPLDRDDAGQPQEAGDEEALGAAVAVRNPAGHPLGGSGLVGSHECATATPSSSTTALAPSSPDSSARADGWMHAATTAGAPTSAGEVTVQLGTTDSSWSAMVRSKTVTTMGTDGWRFSASSA